MASNMQQPVTNATVFMGENGLRSTVLALTLVCISVIVALTWVSPHVDPREPAILRPAIPLVGHIIGLIRHKSLFLSKVNPKSQLPIATLPMLNGKMYAVYEPALIQAVFRNSQLSFLPFASEFAKAELNLSEKTYRVVTSTNIVPEFFAVMHPTLTGQHLHRMNTNALNFISVKLNGTFAHAGWLDIPNFYLWIRGLMTVATTEALYGPDNVFKDNQGLLNDIWTFEGGLVMLLLGFMPGLIAPDAHKARARIQSELGKYYTARGDEHKDAAQITRARANVLRQYNFSGDEIGKFELALLHVATSNTIPTLFWVATYCLSNKERVGQLRKEVEEFVEHRGDTATVNVAKIEDSCPLLVQCYKEALRVSNHANNTRRVMADTTVQDGKGNSYLLKKGVNVQMSASASHARNDVWGADAMIYNPDHFLASENSKATRAAFHPFGGGRHLCPGRTFAFAETLGFVIALLAGYDFQPLDGSDDGQWKLPAMAICSLAEAAAKPLNHGEGFGMRIRRRHGWEKTQWIYQC